MKIGFPTPKFNAKVADGTVGPALKAILEEQKPEAAYFVAEGGKRTGILIIHMDDPSQIPAIAEPWFLALNASVEVTPAMTPEDLMKAGPAVEQAVKAYG